MSTPEILSLALLAVVLALAMWRDINVGLAALPASFVLAAAAGLPQEQVLAGFPADLVLLLLGVMYLFGHAQRSGAVDRLVHGVMRVSGKRDWLLPWSMFVVCAAISAVGTLPGAAVAVVLPVVMRVARTRGIDPVLMAVVSCSGAGVGGFSPLSPWGAMVDKLTAKVGVAYSPGLLFIGLAVVKTLITVVAFFALGGLRLIREGRTRAEAARAVPELRGAAPISRYEIGSLLGLAVFIVSVLVFDLDVGYISLLLGLALQVLFRPDPKRVISELPWAVVLLTAGIMVYVAVLEKTGVLRTMAGHLTDIDHTLLAVLAIGYLAAFFASIESSTLAVLGLVVPLLAAVLPHESAQQFTVLLIVVLATIGAVVINPLHLGGGLVLANTDEENSPRVFRWMMTWSVGAGVLLPPALLVLPLASGI
ncbi:SLC13 family permease [Streptomyces rubradiris]|uniref:SLC13 family permease n=1 Tax=Streptomyces rubradiris TaxID=285531 RepID=UPI0033EBA196